MELKVMTCLLVLACVVYVCGKGSKLRPTKGKMKNRPNDRGGSRGSSDSSSSGGRIDAGATLEYLTRYAFRNASQEERLLAYLFRDYDPVARAVMDTSLPVTVSIDFVLLRIHGLDERSQVLTTTGLVIAEWTDDRLTWKPEDFGNVTDIILKPDKIWLPELAVMNGADELVPDFERIRVLLDSEGRLHWEPGGIFRTTCDIDITYFPFDMQFCPLLIGAYSYYSAKMNITNVQDKITTHDFRLNGEWEVMDTSAVWDITVLDCCPGRGYPHVIFTLHLQRRFKFYIMNIVLPCLMLSVLIMIGFFLPPDAGEKISLGISVLLAFTVFLLMIADNIPRTSLAIPIMVLYLTATMTLGTISVCMTVLVLNVHHRGDAGPVPHWMQSLVLLHMARMFCVRTTIRRRIAHARTSLAHGGEHFYTKGKKLKADGNGVMVDDMELLGLTVNNSNARPPLNGPRTIPPMCDSPGHDVTRVIRRGESFKKSRGRGGSSERQLRRGSTDSEPVNDDYKEWQEFAAVLDRVFFWILFLSMTGSAAFILLFPKIMGVKYHPPPH